MTSSKRTEPTSFINVDLEISSDFDISELVNHLSERLCLLHHDSSAGLNHAGFEVRPSKPKDEPNEFIEVFHREICSLSPALRSAWNKCNRRVFDLGFQAGWKPNKFSSSINAESVVRIAEIQADFVITIYGASTASKTCQPSA